MKNAYLKQPNSLKEGDKMKSSIRSTLVDGFIRLGSNAIAVRTKKYLRRISALVIAGLILAFPAWATDGRTAVGMCIDSTASGARCAWSVNDKGEIDICNKNGCVTCPSATDQCTVAMKRPRPSKSIPEGAEVNTKLGNFKVKGGNGIDELIKPKAAKKPKAAQPN